MGGCCVYRVVQLFWWLELAETHRGRGAPWTVSFPARLAPTAARAFDSAPYLRGLLLVGTGVSSVVAGP